MATSELIISWLKIMVALPIVLFLAYIFLKYSRRYMHVIKKSNNIRVLETVPIYQKSAVSLVKVGQKYLVLGVSDQNIQLITQLSADEIQDFDEEQELKWKTDQVPKWIEKIRDISTKDRRQG